MPSFTAKDDSVDRPLVKHVNYRMGFLSMFTLSYLVSQETNQIRVLESLCDHSYQNLLIRAKLKSEVQYNLTMMISICFSLM